MKTKNYQKVCSVSSELQAAVLQSILEKAGIPVVVENSQSSCYLDILTSHDHVFDAGNILQFTHISVDGHNTGTFVRL